jgi:hypothetical protein
MKHAYVDKTFSRSSQDLIDQANEIIEEYQAQGYSLTLRQLYYQFVARGLVPNAQLQYKRIGSVINDARLAGLIDWTAIEDRTRNLVALSHWSSPTEIVRAAVESYQRDHWEDQPHHVEVWIEKDALTGVIADICDDLDVAYFSCRGYTSQSEMWVAGQRLRRQARRFGNTKPVTIFHLGDHDPSGLDMTRDIQDRLDMFTGGRVKVERIALNMDQVRQYNPPPNPAKLTDSRVGPYIEEFGDESWELDALEPRVMTDLIETAVFGVRDVGIHASTMAREEKERGLLRDAESAIKEQLDAHTKT